MKIHDFPIVKITFFFIIGLLVGFYFKIGLLISLGLQITSIVLFLFSFYFSNKRFLQTNTFGASTFLLFISIGITTNILHDNRTNKNHYSRTTDFDKKHSIILVTRERLKSSLKNDRYYAEVIKIDDKKRTGKVILNIRKNDKNSLLITGSKLLLIDALTPTQKPNNPDQFDYSAYLEHKNIYAQVYTSLDNVKISNEQQKDLYYYIYNFREKIIRKLDKLGFGKEELAILSALILGQQQDISPEVQKDYQYAGAVHILSVSGMHVGFIMIFISILLSPLPNDKKSNIIRIIITITCLWIFTLIAGLSPSVVRSAAMFSFITVGTVLNRQNNTYHTIVVSLFIILLIEPGFLYDIGFQLSYLALFFIVWFQPILKKLWTPKNKVVSYFWDVMTVSIAAQVGTLPLSIFYFHQLPGLFFVSNLVLVPLLFIIMIAGSILMVFAIFDSVPIFLLKTVEISISLMNSFIKEIASFESFIIKNIPLTFTLLILSYILISTFIFLWKKFSYKRLVLFFLSYIAFQFSLININWKVKKEKDLIVFNCINKTILGFKKGNSISLSSDTIISTYSFEKNVIQSYATANYCEISKVNRIKNCYYFKKKKILIIDNERYSNAIADADIIIIRNSPKINLTRILEKIKPEIIIADASNYKSYVTLWKESCKHKKIPFHSTYEKGYYKL